MFHKWLIKTNTRIHIYGCSRCNDRLKAKTEGSTRLTYTGLNGGRELLKIETRLRGERFEIVKTIGVSSIFRLMCSAVTLTRILPTSDLN